jgi:hypothetical protein
MNLLWFEDFGGGLSADSSTLINLFGGLISEQVFDDEWDPEADIVSKPDTLHEFFLKYSNNHRAVLLRQFQDFRDSGFDFSKDFDVVAIDIDLSRGVQPGQSLPDGFSEPPPFHPKSGFYIYNELIRQGFPVENICFLTGEIGTTFEVFADHCRNALIPRPAAFGKDELGLESFRAWLSERSTSPYLRLRRGVIEGTKSLKASLEMDPALFQFKVFLKAGEDEAISAEDYLSTLEQFLPARQPPPADFHRVMRLFVRTVAHEWENNAQPWNVKVLSFGSEEGHANNSRESGRNQRRARASYVLEAYGYVMKEARNWLAHGGLLDSIGPEIAAFLFLVNMRAMFQLPPETQRHECQLFDLMGDRVASIDERTIRADLRQSYSDLMERLGVTVAPDSFLPFYRELAKQYANSATSVDAVYLLVMRILWHQLAQRKGKGGEGYKCDCRPFNFCLSKEPNDFLNSLLLCTYRLAFETLPK